MTGETHTVGGALFLLLGVPIIAPLVGVDVGPLELAVAAATIGPIAGLLPDIDTPNALLSRGWIPFRRSFGWISLLMGFLLSVPARIVGATARLGVEHRGLTHTPQFMLGWTIGALPLYMLFFAMLAYIVSLFTAIFGLNFDPSVVWHWQRDHFMDLLPATMIYVFLGYLSHLVLDSCNPSGVPWSGRKSKHKTNQGKWKTGYKSYHVLPARLRIVTDSPQERPFRWACWLAVILLVLVNVALPIASRLDEGYDVRSAAMYSSAELEAGQGTRSDAHKPATGAEKR
jgi:membrane-bound metal-dependent hydrolase YbcI (DUF457 family)